MKAKKVVLNKSRNVTLTPHIVTGEKKVSFLVCPGGGYKECDPRESLPVAKVLNQKGFNVFVLQYSVGKHCLWPNPLDDFEEAMAYLIAHQKDYAVDEEHIVAIGFSAGGHVVSTAASIAKRKPFAAILCYALSSSETLAYCAPDAPDTAKLVNKNTVPCFLASSRTDWIVPITDTTNLIAAYEEHHIDYEAHIYGFALHGFSVGKEAGAEGPLFCARVGNWVEDALSWLDELMGGAYKSIKERAAYNDANGPLYSTMNSCDVLFANKEVKKLIMRKFPVQYMIYTATQKKVGDFIATVSLRQVLELLQTDQKIINKMDSVLNDIPIIRQKNREGKDETL